MEIKPSIHTAVLDNENIYEHFGIHEITASMYGNKVEDIVLVEVSIADNQQIPLHLKMTQI